MPRTFIGISGFSYQGWRGLFYPQGLPQKQELAYAAERFNSIEINGSFYSLQSASSWQSWHDTVPPGFCFAVKASRYITHLKKLRNVERALPNFFAQGVLLLGRKLGPLLWQLPPFLPFDEERLREFFAALPRSHREAAQLAQNHDDRVAPAGLDTRIDAPLTHVVEPRHGSFDDPAFLRLAQKANVAIVIADTGGKHPLFDAAASGDVVYVRLHGPKQIYASGYGNDDLRRWHDKLQALRSGRDLYVYFDNDVKAYAPRDAQRLAALFSPSRLPPPSDRRSAARR